MDYSVTAFCMLLAWGMFLAEPVIPSLGMLSAFGLGFAGYGVYNAFLIDTNFGWATLIVTAAGGPVAYYLGFKLLRYTPIVLKEELSKAPAYYRDSKKNKVAVGDQGITLSMLRPMGTALINEQKVEVTSEGAMIDPEQNVKVTAVRGRQITVVPLD